MGRTLVVTNDFPPRRGGIESFVHELCVRLPSDEVVVHAASMAGDVAADALSGFPVVRDPTSTLLPTPPVARRVIQTFEHYGCDRVVFGAAAPLGLLGSALRGAGARRVVALTHGHETWWARVPLARRALRRIGDSCDALTYVSAWCRDEISKALSPQAAGRMVRLAPGVDTDRFRPDCGGSNVRARLGIDGDAPLAVCVARMVPRKGQDTLLRAWPRVLDAAPHARLLLVGDGPARRRVEERAKSVGDTVVVERGVPWSQVPAYLDAGDVFAMPCRTRRAGLEPEALGIVALEAAACRLPVVIGDSGGAPETVRHGESGYVVDPHNPAAVGVKVADLLVDRRTAKTMGSAGRAWVQAEWTWDAGVETLRALLDH
jgi:phosphatidyl-myo-inositol dimannoside synthase